MKQTKLQDEKHDPIPFVRAPVSGMGEALVHRTIFRRDDEKQWANVARRVAHGNTSLVPGGEKDYVALRNSIAAGRNLMSGRHLQHGDESQSTRNMEVFTNCSVTASSFSLFYLLLNGSGVGRDYSEQMLLVDYDKAPHLINVCNPKHKDFDASIYEPARFPRVRLASYITAALTAVTALVAALALLPGGAWWTGAVLMVIALALITAMLHQQASKTIYFRVPDSREGWAKAQEIYELMTYEGVHADKTLILDWSGVRPNGSPIQGMQSRPASGPNPVARAIGNIGKNVRGKGYALWRQTMMVDHYLAECVLVGGARRAARMATMSWKDPHAKDFALFKRAHLDQNGFPIYYSSNNSICCTEEFYAKAQTPGTWANEVFETATSTGYQHGTGEPGFINVDRFAKEKVDFDLYADGDYMDSFKYKVDRRTKKFLGQIALAVRGMPYYFITNPCGEIKLFILCGYCVISDTVPFHANTIDEAEEAFRLATRALIRTNTMPSLFRKEVERTNRIGVGFTGLHEFAIKFFNIGFREMLDEHGAAREFWATMARFSRAVKSEAASYSAELKRARPATDTTVKPAGSTSKIYGLTEGAHLAAMREYLRWMQFRNDDPLVQEYAEKGYPTQKLKSYAGTTIVGFPTQPTICKLGRPELVTTASEATPEEQYKYLQLLEKYWITGVDEAGSPLPDTGNQVSYTLKFDPKSVSFEDFRANMLRFQSTVKCCSVMPQEDATAYEYQPEEPIARGRFLHIVENLKDPTGIEQFDLEALRCASGACPI